MTLAKLPTERAPRKVYDPQKYQVYLKRKYERKQEKRHSQRQAVNIIGIDGEGVTVENGEHHYILLAASDGSCVEGVNLSTVECFDYLLSLPKGLKIGFSINYDINMMLKDLGLRNLQALWEDGETRWNAYKISWIPSKKFSLVHVFSGKTVTVWDAFGFFQCSFVRALKQWDIGTPEERDRIASMKELRGSFTESEFNEIKAYCFDEVRLLVKLVEKLITQCERMGINLTSYHGAGSIAAALLRKHDVKSYLKEPPSEEIFRASLQAYFGGRFEIARVGPIPEECWNYDIRSAYPHQCRRLPCLSHGTWRHLYGSRIPQAIARFGIYRVLWKLSDGREIWAPFPWRTKNNHIVYPVQGEGWYWGEELDAAMQLWPGDIEYIEAYIFTPNCEHRPFAFVEELYEERNRLKAEGDFGQLVLKLGLNSLYGKTAQSIGAKDRKPTYQSFIWAGLITSGTRAQLLSAIRLSPNDIISVATDGIISTRQLRLDIGQQLGEWEETAKITNLFLAQPGVYRYTANGQTVSKTRGFTSKEVKFDDLANVYSISKWYGSYTFHCTRFIGLGAALQRNPPLTNWRRWIEVEKKVSLRPAGRCPAQFMGDMTEYPYTKMVAMPILGHREIPTEMSFPYKMKSEWKEMWTNDPAYREFVERMDQPEFVE